MKKLLLVGLIALLLCPVTLLAADTLVELTWGVSSSSDVTGYYIYRSTTQGAGYAKVNPTPVVELTYTDTIPGDVETTFYYVVTATDGPNESGYSNEAFIRIDNIAPGVVPGLQIKSVTIQQ